MPVSVVVSHPVAMLDSITKPEEVDTPVVALPTPPSTHTSRSTSPVTNLEESLPEGTQTAQKKKKKKKSKKPAKAQDTAPAPRVEAEECKPPVLCISRNKHWRYISSYHGPWLQLPLELLDSLLVLNLDPATLSAADARHHSLPSPSTPTHPYRLRDRGFAGLGDHSPPESPRGTFTSLPPPPMPAPRPGKATPPPIDPGVFRSVTHIRRLIDEASELSVRASSGLSAAALGSLRSGSSNNSPWATAQSLGINPLGESGGGRNVAMSAMRVHRLRALAVQKLAAAYRADEIASSVMVMQGGSVFDDIAERVLKVDPHDIDARYVHFFHEKIPSSIRQLAESTTTDLLDELISAHPHRLELFRTRGIVHCFRDEYPLAVKDFTHAIKEARALRRAKAAHRNNLPSDKQRGKGAKKKKGRTNGQAPPNGTSARGDDCSAVDGPDGEQLLVHPSVLPDAPEPIEPQCFFLRAAAYLQHAVHLIEGAVLKLEGIRKGHSVDGAELRLCYIENSKYGGVEIGHPDGPLGKKDGAKLAAYRAALAEEGFREQVSALVRKAMRDHEKFLAHFDTLESAPDMPLAPADLAARAAYAFRLSEALRPGSQSAPPPPPPPDAPALFTTYHPLLVESHYSVLLCLLLLGDFPALLPAFCRAASLVDGLEGYPVFLPPRSMAQAEFVEVLERLASGWRTGVQSHALLRARPALEPPRSPKAKDVDRAPSPPSPAAERPAPAMLGVNGSSSSAAVHASPAPSGRETPASSTGRVDLVEALDAARVLLAPVAVRQREKAEKAAADRAAVSKSKGQKKPLNINIPLHGPRVEIVLAWLGAVHLVELDSVA
ncbi:hypothetical protein CERSUDRAFT_118622 [Gelatoporia subvermispora B]|uniref:Uncharacterized protein n=1 Tax=Ceriporiopsis subvermispora (strain B) TaxID=914234 RepID=M2Q6X5_CERS8|nr:hypothetical protein CERSUDRAFT_118622 [Gelatoporia subvermispora B]